MNRIKMKHFVLTVIGYQSLCVKPGVLNSAQHQSQSTQMKEGQIYWNTASLFVTP